MHSEGEIQQLSRGHGPSVHRYYDVPVEEPGGDRILYFEFASTTIPGPGQVMVADADGANPRPVARAEDAIGHVGSNAIWIDAERIAHSPRQRDGHGAVVVCLAEGSILEQLPMDIRSYHPGTGLAILQGEPGLETSGAHRLRQQLTIWNARTGETESLLTAREAWALHPHRERFEVEKTNFQNPKWSPDGLLFFVVFGTEIYRKTSKDWDYPAIKCLICGKADGSCLRYLTEFSHHPMWHPEGKGILAHVRREGAGQDLLYYPLDGSEPEIFYADLPGVHCTPDHSARRLITDVFDHERGTARIVMFEVTSRNETVLAEGRHGDFDHTTGAHPHPQWSRDETRAFFNMADTGIPQLYAVRLS